MVLGPLPLGRLPNLIGGQQLERQLRAQRLALARLQEQLATGSKYQVISESPSSAMRALTLEKLLERRTQVQSNLKLTQSLLAQSDASLGGLSEALSQAHGLAVGSIGVGASQAERLAAANEVRGMIDSLLAAGNGQFLGRYLFGGRQQALAPFAREDDAVRYLGDDGTLRTYGDLDELIATNIAGNSTFGTLTAEAGDGADLDPQITTATRLSDLHAGRGVRGGALASIEIDDGAGPPVVIDMSAAATIGDVIDLINAAGAGVTAAINAAGNGLSLTPGAATIEVREVNGGTTAADLGIATSGPATPPLVGGDLDPRLTLTTRLADLFGGAGFDQASGLVVTNGDLAATIDFAGAATVEDLLNRLNGAGVGIRAAINEAGDGLSVRGELSGVDFSIGENGGTTASDLGVRTMTGATALASLNYGLGAPNKPGTDFTITASDGTVIGVDLAGAETVGDVLALINAHPSNGGRVLAQLAAVGNGIELVDTAGGASDLAVTGGERLGLGGSVPAGGTLTGDDVAVLEVKGVFTSLLRLQAALEAGDDAAIQRVANLLDDDINRVNLARADLGGSSRALERLERRLEDDEIVLTETLSRERDTDFAAAVAEFQQRQAALEATLKFAGAMMQLSLFSFL